MWRIDTERVFSYGSDVQLIPRVEVSMTGPKTVPVDDHKRSKPSPVPPGGRDYPKPGPKTVPVDDHRRSPPKR